MYTPIQTNTQYLLSELSGPRPLCRAMGIRVSGITTSRLFRSKVGHHPRYRGREGLQSQLLHPTGYLCRLCTLSSPGWPTVGNWLSAVTGTVGLMPGVHELDFSSRRHTEISRCYERQSAEGGGHAWILAESLPERWATTKPLWLRNPRGGIGREDTLC